MVSEEFAREKVANGQIPPNHLCIVTGLAADNLQKLDRDAPVKEPADFETAIAATGYGKFNILLLLCTFPAFFSAVSVTSAVSYIFTRAKCDMNLSLLNMGTISGVTYGGMITSALIWGFLSDTLGRRRIMIWGFIASGFVELTAAMSQNFAMLLVTRFMAGFLFNGPFAVLLSYIAEMHKTELRARVILFTNLFFTIASTTLPLLAWGILTRDFDISILGGWIVIRSWNLFLFTTGLVPLLTGLAFYFLPESPKFLMSRGRNDEAIIIFQKIYSLNKGKSKDEYPIQKLLEEKTEYSGRGAAALKGGFQQIKPLFQRPLLPWLILLCVIHVGAMFGSNTLRLWYPQLAAMITSTSNDTLCTAITPTAVSPIIPEEVELCIPIETNMMTYLQSAIVGIGSLVTFGIGGMLINRCGKKLVSGVCNISFAVIVILVPVLGNDAYSVMGMMTTALAFTSLSGASLSSIIVDLFPTRHRVMAMATFLMCGRLGTITGTIAFPALLEYGCYPPFITIGVVLIVCGGACFVVPNTTLKKLE